MFCGSDDTSGCRRSTAACASLAASVAAAEREQHRRLARTDLGQPALQHLVRSRTRHGGVECGVRAIQLRERRVVVALLLERERELRHGARQAGLVLPIAPGGRAETLANVDLRVAIATCSGTLFVRCATVARP